MATLIKIDRNGSKHYEGMVPCDRCGGAGGADAWKFTGWTCYKCGGTGKVLAKWIERTPEYEAKLAARRQAKWDAQREEREAKAAELEAAREAERKRQEEEAAREAARKAVSQHVGTVGEKITFKAVLEGSAHFEVRFGWQTTTMYVHTFRDADGNALVWKTSSNGLWDLDDGDAVEVTATIKNHGEYKDEKQTELTRCKVKAINK